MENCATDNDGDLVDRMSTVISGLQVDKLLSMPKIQASTADMMGDAVVQDMASGLCFDMTSTNTGVHTGAIKVIEKGI